MEYPPNQSAWKRGWNDTKAGWTDWRFVVLEAVVAVVIGGVFAWYWGLAVVVFGMLCVWVGATASAPVRQRNDARRALSEIPSRRKSIADRLAEYYEAGVRLKQDIARDDFGGDAVGLCNAWGNSVIEYFRANPVELGDSKLLSLVPRYGDWFTFQATGLGDMERDYVHRHLSIELDKMLEMIGELSNDKL